MNDIVLILEVIGLFLLRIGIPLILLVTLGTLIDRWQSRAHKNQWVSPTHTVNKPDPDDLKPVV